MILLRTIGLNVLLAFFSYGQQRIGFDFATKGTTLSATATYNKVIKQNFLLSAGIFLGNFGSGFMDLNMNQFQNDQRVSTPFSDFNLNETDALGNSYTLFDYASKGKGYGIQLGVGYFYEFKSIHGVRFNLNNRLGRMNSSYSIFYYNDALQSGVHLKKNRSHFIGAISPEIYHTMRITGKITLFYGFKFPFYYSIDKGQFNPLYVADLFNKWEPELSIGLTYVVGKCDD
jgi:hypothetical protein